MLFTVPKGYALLYGKHNIKGFQIRPMTNNSLSTLPLPTESTANGTMTRWRWRALRWPGTMSM